MGVPTVHKYENGKLKENGIFNDDRTLEKLLKFTEDLNVSKKTLKKSKKKKKKKRKRSSINIK